MMHWLMKQQLDWHHLGDKKETHMAKLILRKTEIVSLLILKGMLQIILFILNCALGFIKVILMMFIIMARIVWSMVGIASTV